MRFFVATAFVCLVGCTYRSCGAREPQAPDEEALTGIFGHETLSLTMAAAGDDLVLRYRSLYARSTAQCDCMLHLKREGPLRWAFREGEVDVLLRVEDGEIVLEPEDGRTSSFPGCGADWEGDRVLMESRAPLGICTVLSSEILLSLPQPPLAEPELGSNLVYRGDQLQGSVLPGAFDKLVLVRFAGGEPFVGLAPANELDCAGD